MASRIADGALVHARRARTSIGIWRRFQRGGIPWYLARHYWWAYLWRGGVWFWDHPRVINAVLFGQYHRLMAETLRRAQRPPRGRTLQLTCVYGELTPTLARRIDGEFHLMDVAGIQLAAARRKLNGRAPGTHLARMDAEALAYADACFDTVVIFFLLHELPAAVRANVLAETLRVARPGARVVITEYGALARRHVLHRVAPLRGLLGTVEPFLSGFWTEDLDSVMEQAARRAGRHVEVEEHSTVFDGFYRVVTYRVAQHPETA